jgi:peptidoglycan/LPS O-acetylase OafA/YrhL
VTGIKRLTALDGLRGVAAIAVVAWHWQHFFAISGDWQPGWTRSMQPFFWLLKPLYVQGWAAVDLFFVLSGFVFFWLYRDSIRSGATGAWKFSVLRISRLYPLHFVMLIAVANLQLVFFRANGQFFIYEPNDLPHFVAHLFMVQNWWPDSPQTFDGPTWSVSIEMLLYVLFFVACRLGPMRGAHCLVAALAGALLLTFDEHIARGVIGFFMGGFIFAIWGGLRDDPRAGTISRVLAWTSLAGWAVLCAMLYGDSPWLEGGEGNNQFLIVFDFFLCPLTVLALALRESAGRTTPAWLGNLGDVSYSTYLIHFPLQLSLALVAAQFALTPAFFMNGGVMIAFLVVLIGLGALSYRYFERPMQDILRRLAAPRPVSAE